MQSLRNFGNQQYRLFNQLVTDPQQCLNSILSPIRTCVLVRVTEATLRSCPVVNTMHTVIFKQMSF